MKSNEIRKKFLEFFNENGHTIVSSSSLIPDKDPSLLFVNAGMVQFKNLFLGIEKREYVRATTCQKCVRAGGKHNDLENVGKTLRHHTFFEMLGNFSFGDYFKEDAIAYAWKLLGDIYQLDKKKMWITVYKDDDEAAKIWKSIGIREDRIVRLGEKDNFWSMGEEGPCGPCSEILYDLGEHVGCKRPSCAVGCDCDRFLEIWNLVFMEFDRSGDGKMTKLPRPSIDTGMGLERIASIMQGKLGNYETDLFRPIITRLEDVSHNVYGENEKTDIAMRVISDHIRGATFVINDGVLPSKDGRGYVLRRILRRALRYGKKIGIEREFLSDLSSTVVDIMGDVYPDIKNNHPYIVRVIKGEEERFIETLSTGMKVYDEFVDEISSKGESVMSGEMIYKLYDTFGFPLDITTEMAQEDGLSMDMDGFARSLEEQKERSRTSSRIKGEGLDQVHVSVLKQGISSEFLGYDMVRIPEARIITLIKNDTMVDEIRAGETGEAFFDQTPFYAESGGQVEDEGTVDWTGGTARVTAAKKIKEDLFSHTIVVEKGILKKNQVVDLSINTERRKSIARNHTATHLLQYALRQILGDHVKQSGSLVDKDRLRFDFTHFQAMDESEVARVEDIVNEKIMEDIDVCTQKKSREEAMREGATALFEEKYGDEVRVVSISDFSAELCGGTHVRNTGEIGSFYIVSEGSLASGVRRIEAVTGKSALDYKRKMDATIRGIARVANTEPERVRERIENLVAELNAQSREMEKLKDELTGYKVEDAIKGASEKDGVKVVSLFVPNARAEDLRKVTDIIRDRVKSCVAVVGTRDNVKGMVIVAVSKDLLGKYNAGKMMKKMMEHYGGKGGGGPQIAQGGVPGDKIKAALSSVIELMDN
ncbi:MAG TPA: alanine--tRNA ligase [Syntrophorhabdus sp.]|nr:alanine--tRNA ligase [Syntrophorhabdus sp.]OPX93630.1 MAG: Alanine--tRNA ligase [Syntrophorhabdus sp. PtaB.Bin027]HQG25781.1 alanine--tRNA ligase [Syntrophorhabdus sp.]HQI96290.1 alanine--tRNA ligase [Syntrophorhabdus sp.]HQM25163.1 alanine--tRNA ligase [Syntrophorhabdus sp.]